MKKLEKMKELIDEIIEADKYYYQYNQELMLDVVYDEKYDELKKLEDELGIQLAHSPTQKVGSEVLSKLEKVEHIAPLLSLEKTKDPQEMKDLLGNETGLLSPKLDGLTIELTYSNGELMQALTRGNGYIGENVTHNAKYFKNIPLTIPFKGELRVRGEAVINIDDFNKINELLPVEEKYKNPRNLASGSVRKLDNKDTPNRHIYFYAFGVNGLDGDFKSSNLEKIGAMGFDVVEYTLVTKEDVEEEVYRMAEDAKQSNVEKDGLVLTIDDINKSVSLGTTSKHPKDSIAYKWEDEKAITHITDIIYQTGRLGTITPVAIFEPVELLGTTVTKASLHNISIMEDLQLGIGDKVEVFKANMIIPQIYQNLTKSNSFELPTKCPSCGGDVTIQTPQESKNLVCLNPSCPQQLMQSMKHFVGREAMNIEGLNEKTLQKFIEQGYIKTFADIYQLENYKEDIASLPGFGEKSVQKILDNIEASRKVNLENFIYSLGINLVGRSVSKELVKNFDSIEAIINATQEQIESIEGIGEKIAHNFTQYFASQDNLDLVYTLLSYLQINVINSKGGSNIMGMTFVVTGKVENFENRDHFKSFIEDHGGKVAGSVSKNTDYLVTNDPGSGSSKNRKARELGVMVIDENEAIEIIKG